eukprot:3230473-Pleurochrysis_carterae.AAC.3
MADHAGASKKTEHHKRWEYCLRVCQPDDAIRRHESALYSQARPSDRLQPHQGSRQDHFSQAAPASDSLRAGLHICEAIQLCLTAFDLCFKRGTKLTACVQTTIANQTRMCESCPSGQAPDSII